MKLSDSFVNEWFHNQGYKLSYWPSQKGWLVENKDQTHVLLFRQIEDVKEWVSKQGVIDPKKVQVIRDERKAP